MKLNTPLNSLVVARTGIIALCAGTALFTNRFAIAHEDAAHDEIEIHGETIMYAGHGMLFDKNMREITVDSAFIPGIQDAMINDILTAPGGDPPWEVNDRIEQAQELLGSGELNIDEVILLKSGIVGLLLKHAPEELIAKYAWRNNALATLRLSYLDRLVELEPEVVQPLKDGILGLFPLVSPAANEEGGDTPYMAACRGMDVPIPPDWAETGTDWVSQGTLTQNLLSPGKFAEVWTYSDPLQRGACIALPRRSDSSDTNNGIICQSATTGHACFWDNKLKSDPLQQVIGWQGLTLEIATLRDGTDLIENCTGCHRGNNVFLMAPDDPTWNKLLNGPLNGPVTGTFTTEVQSSAAVVDDCPRYIPITTTPPRPNWENPYSAPGCAEGCHLGPPPGVVTFGQNINLQMPPMNLPAHAGDSYECSVPGPRLQMRRSLSFGSVPQKDVRSRLLTISNPLGTSDLTVSIAASPPPPAGQPISGFFWTSFSAVIAPGQSRTFLVDFSPRAAALFTGHLTVTTNMPRSQHTVSLTGRGMPLEYEGGGRIEPL